MSDTGRDLHIGRRSTYYLKGLIDDVRIYNRALSAGEIEDIYKGKNTSASGLVGHWSMHEGEEGFVSDISGNNNHGTIVGAQWTTDCK